jgi:hypothetical protein
MHYISYKRHMTNLLEHLGETSLLDYLDSHSGSLSEEVKHALRTQLELRLMYYCDYGCTLPTKPLIERNLYIMGLTCCQVLMEHV